MLHSTSLCLHRFGGKGRVFAQLDPGHKKGPTPGRSNAPVIGPVQPMGPQEDLGVPQSVGIGQVGDLLGTCQTR